MLVYIYDYCEHSAYVFKKQTCEHFYHLWILEIKYFTPKSKETGTFLTLYWILVIKTGKETPGSLL